MVLFNVIVKINILFLFLFLVRKPRNRVFDNHNLRKDTKVMIYKAVCITTLRERGVGYTYRCHLKTLEKFHECCLRKILCIRWEDCCTNASILMEANTTSIEAMVMQNQLTGLTTVLESFIQASHQTLGRQVLFAQLTHGTRTVGIGGHTVERWTVNRGTVVQSNLPPFKKLRNFVHPTFACVFRKRH